MAENEYFKVGAIIACSTCYQQKFQGEVMAFDLGTKNLIISILLVTKFVPELFTPARPKLTF